MSLFHVKVFILVVFSPLTRARSSPDAPEVLHMQGTSLCCTGQLPSLLKQTLVHACKFCGVSLQPEIITNNFSWQRMLQIITLKDQ